MNTMMDTLQRIDNISILVDLFKVIKTDMIVIVMNGVVYASNSEFSYIKKIVIPEFMNIQVSLCYSVSDVATIANKNFNSLFIDEYYNMYVYMNGESNPYIYRNMVIPPYGLFIINNCEYISQHTPDKSYEDITDDPAVIMMNTMLTADGNSIFRKDGYFMTLFKGLLPCTKTDKIGLDIFNEYDEKDKLTFFVSKFRITKKKFKSPIDVFIKYRYV